MAKKFARKNKVKRKVLRVSKKSILMRKPVPRTPPRVNKIGFALKNLFLFLILTLLSYLLLKISTNQFLITFFSLLSSILAFVSLAFLIVLLIFLGLRLMRK